MINLAVINEITGIVENTIVFQSKESARDFKIEGCVLVELQDGFGIGDKYIDGKFVKIEISQPTPEEQRAMSYEAEPIVEWGAELITVDSANKKYYNYFVEGSEKANQLQRLIIKAKKNIRERYPDENEV